MREKWTPHIIAVNTLVVFIVLGLACASAPEGTVAQETRQEVRQDNSKQKVQQDNSESDFQIAWDENVSGGIKITKYIGSKKEVRIPASIQNNPVTCIGGRAFDNCTSITSVIIPDSVTSIGYRAFLIRAWLDNQPDGVVYAGKVAYTYKGTMPANTKITLLDGTKGIADSAFADCTNLTSITIPDSVTYIGDSAFNYCDSLTSVTIPNSITYIGHWAFDETAWLNNQPNGIVYAGKVAYTYKGTMPANTSITLLDGTKGIAGHAFLDCKNLTRITLPNIRKTTRFT